MTRPPVCQMSNEWITKLKEGLSKPIAFFNLPCTIGAEPNIQINFTHHILRAVSPKIQSTAPINSWHEQKLQTIGQIKLFPISSSKSPFIKKEVKRQNCAPL